MIVQFSGLCLYRHLCFFEVWKSASRAVGPYKSGCTPVLHYLARKTGWGVSNSVLYLTFLRKIPNTKPTVFHHKVIANFKRDVESYPNRINSIKCGDCVFLSFQSLFEPPPQTYCVRLMYRFIGNLRGIVPVLHRSMPVLQDGRRLFVKSLFLSQNLSEGGNRGAEQDHDFSTKNHKHNGRSTVVSHIIRPVEFLPL